MTIFLGFRTGILLDTGADEQLSQCIADFRRIDQIGSGNAEITIILQHAGIFDFGNDAGIAYGMLSFVLAEPEDIQKLKEKTRKE